MPYGGVCLMRSMPYEGFDCIRNIVSQMDRRAWVLSPSDHIPGSQDG